MNQIQNDSATTITEWWKRHAERLQSAKTHRLQVFVRSMRPPPGAHEQREQLFEKLRIAEQKGQIDGFDILVTGKEVCLCNTCRNLTPKHTVREDLLELADWNDEGATAWGFDRRHVSCSFTDEEYDVLVPPETAFGVYLDRSLSGVFPCTVDGERYGVDLYLRSLVEDRPPLEPTNSEGHALLL